MPYDSFKPCLSKNPVVKELVLPDPHSESLAKMDARRDARRDAAQVMAMRRDFEAEGWASLDAKVSSIFELSKTAETQKFLDVVKSGLTYIDKILNDLTVEHSSQLVKNRFASTYIALLHAQCEALVRKGEDATEAELDMMVSYYKEITEKAPILGQMKSREAVYAGGVESAREMKAKLETVERVAESLLAKQQAQDIMGSKEAVEFLTVAMKCVDSTWLSIHSIRLGITKVVEKEEKVRIKEFVASMEGTFGDGSKKKVTAMVEKDEVIVEDEA